MTYQAQEARRPRGSPPRTWRAAFLWLLCLASLSAAACAGTHTQRQETLKIITTGFHALPGPFARDRRPKRFIVWSENSGVVSILTTAIQRAGQTVVERAHVQQFFEGEQRFRLTHTPENEADLLRVGALLGVDDVIFADVTTERAGDDPLFFTSVAVRAVRVKSGEVRWSGTANYSSAIPDPDTAAPLLAQMAAARATCPVEAGYEWHEPIVFHDGSMDRQWGCHKKAPEPAPRGAPTPVSR